MRRFLEYNGIDPDRFQAKWISGSEAAKFRDTVAQVSARIKELGPNNKLVGAHYDNAVYKADTEGGKG